MCSGSVVAVARIYAYMTCLPLSYTRQNDVVYRLSSHRQFARVRRWVSKSYYSDVGFSYMNQVGQRLCCSAYLFNK
jgi:hypothetical protein